MLRAVWGERGRGELRRVAAQLGLRTVEHGPLAVAGDGLDIASAGAVRCVFIGRLVGVEQGACAQQLLDLRARDGLSAFSRLHGSYVAFVSEGERAWVLRDRLGAHTLSYSSSGGEVVLGEHDADVLELLPSTPAPDRMAVVQWIEHGTLPEGRSLFGGVRRLRAGHLLELTPNSAKERSYWQPSYEGVDDRSREDLADMLREETFAAIARARGGAHAPALCVSGGLDSACVAAGLAHQGGPPAQALGITFPMDPDVDESAAIEATARFSGLPLTRVPFEGGEMLPPALRHLQRWKVPPPSPMMLVWEPVWPLAREMGIDLILDGQGGDELFGTLASKYLIADRLRAGRLRQAWNLSGSLAGPDDGELAPARLRLGALRRIGLSGALPGGFQASRRSRLPRERVVSRLVRDEDVRALVAQDDPWSFKRREGPLWWRAMVAMFMDNPDAMDANGFFRRYATDAGIERRHPLVHDVRLLERVLRTPPETAFDATRDRPLLRDALAGHIAEEIRTQHVKLVFNSVVVSRMSGEEGRGLAAEILLADAPVREYVDGASLEPLFEPHHSRTRDPNARSIQLYTIGLINRWLLALEGRGGGAGPADGVA